MPQIHADIRDAETLRVACRLLRVPLHGVEPTTGARAAEAPHRQRAEEYYDSRLPKNRPDPLAIAQVWVAGLDRLKMTKDGHPIRLDTLMRMTYAALAKNRLEQVAVNPNRVV